MEPRRGSRRESLRQLLVQFGQGHAEETEYTFSLDGGQARASVIVWASGEPLPVTGPRQANLEQLACAAIADAYPERVPDVAGWLEPVQDFPDKAWAWSHMSRWYPEGACERFYSGLWEDAPVAEALEARLTAQGFWSLMLCISGASTA